MPKQRVYRYLLYKSRLKSLPTGTYPHIGKRQADDQIRLALYRGPCASIANLFAKRSTSYIHSIQPSSAPGSLCRVFCKSNSTGYEKIGADEKTSPLRPYFASAILRLARPMNNLEYESFIDLQDKLHQNLCRMRKFVAIGTHDLDTIEGPFRYVVNGWA
jgi:hypothetical protein